MTLQQMIAGCFGGGYFASHPPDEDRAFRLLQHCRLSGIGWKELRREIVQHMGAAFGTPHGNAQLARARSMLKPWLLD